MIKATSIALNYHTTTHVAVILKYQPKKKLYLGHISGTRPSNLSEPGTRLTSVHFKQPDPASLVVFKGPVQSGLLTRFCKTRTKTALGPGPSQLGPGPDCGPGPILVLHQSRTDPNRSRTVVSLDQSLTGSDQSLHLDT